WTALTAMTGATPAAGSINPNQPGNLTTTWSPNPTGAIWSWGVVTALSTSGLIDPTAGTIIGNFSRDSNAFDGNTAQDNSQVAFGGTYIGKHYTAGAQAISACTVFPSTTVPVDGNGYNNVS